MSAPPNNPLGGIAGGAVIGFLIATVLFTSGKSKICNTPAPAPSPHVVRSAK